MANHETPTSMSGTILPTIIVDSIVPDIHYVSTANNVSNVGGDPVAQLIVNVYQMIKL